MLAPHPRFGADAGVIQEVAPKLASSSKLGSGSGLHVV
jgi:hypothetical protein